MKTKLTLEIEYDPKVTDRQAAAVPLKDTIVIRSLRPVSPGAQRRIFSHVPHRHTFHIGRRSVTEHLPMWFCFWEPL